MADPFVSEIRIFAFDFAPRGWARCQGQILPLSQNTALFALLGTTFGGNGITNFGLPDFQNRIPIGFGRGPGLSEYFMGQSGGQESVTLLTTDIPAHRHTARCNTSPAESESPSNAVWATDGASATTSYAAVAAPVNMASAALAPSGTGVPHENRMPTLGLNFCIALQGVFPPRQ